MAKIKAISTQDTKDKIRAQRIGSKASAETKAKMSAQRMGNTYGRAGKGLKRSEETKERMSTAQKARYAAARCSA